MTLFQLTHPHQNVAGRQRVVESNISWIFGISFRYCSNPMILCSSGSNVRAEKEGPWRQTGHLKTFKGSNTRTSDLLKGSEDIIVSQILSCPQLMKCFVPTNTLSRYASVASVCVLCPPLLWQHSYDFKWFRKQRTSWEEDPWRLTGRLKTFKGQTPARVKLLKGSEDDIFSQILCAN